MVQIAAEAGLKLHLRPGSLSLSLWPAPEPVTLTSGDTAEGWM